jgi:GT2 family glycosyltransferase
VAVRPGEWWATAPAATLFVPAGADAATTIGSDAAALDPHAGVTMRPRRGGVSVVQNAGNELTPDLWVRDRGAREPDGGRYDDPVDVWGWCGGAVLLRADYLADTGWMDERFFLYWEDVDLSWRGARRGWRYRYVPASVVRHRHGASMGDRSPRFEYLNQRNRLVVLARHAGGRAAAQAWARHAAEIGWFAWRDVVVALVRRRRPEGHRAAVRARSLAGAVGLLMRGPGR